MSEHFKKGKILNLFFNSGNASKYAIMSVLTNPGLTFYKKFRLILSYN